MIIEMIQQPKGLFDADFTFCWRGETIGDYHVQGSLGTMKRSSKQKKENIVQGVRNAERRNLFDQ